MEFTYQIIYLSIFILKQFPYLPQVISFYAYVIEIDLKFFEFYLNDFSFFKHLSL